MEDKLIFGALEIKGNGEIGRQLKMDLDNPGEFIEIPLYKGGRKKVKKEETDIAQENMRIQNEKQWYK